MSELEIPGALGVIAATLVAVVGSISAFRKIIKMVRYINSLKKERQERNNKEFDEKVARSVLNLFNQMSNQLTQIHDLVINQSQDIKRSHFWWQAMMDMDPQAKFITDKSGLIISANLAFLRMLRRSLDEVSGNNWFNAISSEDRDRVCHEWDSSIKAGRNFELQFDVRVNDSLILVYCLAIYNPDFGHIATVAMLGPKRKDAEEEGRE